MASDLLILTPYIAQRATRSIAAVNFAGTANESFYSPALNSTRGPRWHMWRSSSTSTAHYLTHDLGPFASAQINFLVLSRLDILKALAQTITVTIASSDDDTTYTTQHNIADIDALTLIGPDSNDYYTDVSTTGLHRWWRAAFTTGGAAFAQSIGKVYYGMKFDMGVDVDDYAIERVYDSYANFETQGGARLLGRSSQPRYKLTLDWNGVSDSLIQSFFTDIFPYRYTTTFFLYTQNYHGPLNNHRLMQMALIDAQTDNEDEKDDYNFLRTKWVQVLG